MCKNFILLNYDTAHRAPVTMNKIDLPVRTDNFCAIYRPATTANPVHKKCPNNPPIITPSTSYKTASQPHKNIIRT